MLYDTMGDGDRDRSSALALTGALVEIDTSPPVDVPALAELVRSTHL